MVLPIVKYGHPVLRQRGGRIDKITSAITQLIGDMLETMRAAKGVGLAAQQVGQALQLTVLDVREVTDRPSSLYLNGEVADLAAFMPLVLINPEVKPLGNSVPGPEGCLSFPEMYADIARAESVEVTAINAQGAPVEFRCSGLLARAIQHELDHLRGILFIDRMSAEDKQALRPKLDALQAATKAALIKRAA
jgi:peptide deformylase